MFRSVMALGRTLLRVFFETRAMERPAGPVLGTDGTELAYHDRRAVTYLSVFGKCVFRRHAFGAPGQGWARLNVGTTGAVLAEAVRRMRNGELDKAATRESHGRRPRTRGQTSRRRYKPGA